MVKTRSSNVTASDSEHTGPDLNPPQPHYTVDTITSERDLFRIRDDWDRLSISASQPNVFTTFDWYEAWYRHFIKGDQAGRLRPNVLVVRKDGVVSGIAPLTSAEVVKYGIRLKRIQFAGRNHEWDYNDLLVGEDLDHHAAALAEHLKLTKREWDLMDLMDVRDIDGAVAHIQNAMTRQGLHCQVLPTEERCPYFPIESTWEQMLLRRSRSTRHSYRNRQSRQIKLTGDRLRRRVVIAPHTEPGLLRRMIALESQKRSGGVLSAPFLGESADVFESLWHSLGTKGWLCVTLLEWDDRLLAFQLLFCCGKKLWGYLTAYDHEFAHLSPGATLISAASDYGFANGFDEFDFLSGEESYKLHWATGFHQRSRMLIWNDRLKSLMYSTYMRRRIASRPFLRSHNEPEV